MERPGQTRKRVFAPTKVRAWWGLGEVAWIAGARHTNPPQAASLGTFLAEQESTAAGRHDMLLMSALLPLICEIATGVNALAMTIGAVIIGRINWNFISFVLFGCPAHPGCSKAGCGSIPALPRFSPQNGL